MITVVIPTSPLIIHPDTTNIERCIASIKSYLPDCRIIVTFDGIRPETEHHRASYELYRQRLGEVYKDFKRPEMTFIEFYAHRHQSGMMSTTLEHVETDLLLYVEHDWELVGEIPFKEMGEIIACGEANLIRVLYPTELPSYYMDMMIDKTPRIINGIPLTQTIQWSQNPHLASTEFYREISKLWKPKTFIEESMVAHINESMKTFIYTPEGNTQRCVHYDGRKGEIA